VALSLQIGTNYANDYSDGARGTDRRRVGPFRLTASGLVPGSSVRAVAVTFYGIAALAGLLLASLTAWWLIAVGASAIAAGWLYTGGPRPYGYSGLGELFVFIYFGLVATVGTAFVQAGHIHLRDIWLGAALGAAACTLLEANNLRDIDSDAAANKRTLAVRLGRKRGGWLYAFFVVLATSTGAWGSGGKTWWTLVIFVVADAFYEAPISLVFSEKEGRELLPLLGLTARAQLLLGVTFTIALLAIHPH
jgi:1,4-dihydroxy-2-naphthoate octaprenyltransferase